MAAFSGVIVTTVIKLDRSRPFSVTFGGGNGVQYHQDGHDYDAQYQRIGNIETPPAVVESDAPKKRGRPRKE